MRNFVRAETRISAIAMALNSSVTAYVAAKAGSESEDCNMCLEDTVENTQKYDANLSSSKESCKDVGETLKKTRTSEVEYQCICGLLVKHELKQLHNCISELREIVDNQASCILGLQDSVKKVRKYVRNMEKRILEIEADFRTEINKKVAALSENLNKVMMLNTRRCDGRCRKHVRTEKCLCRGFTTAAPHVCCGKQGGICEC